MAVKRVKPKPMSKRSNLGPKDWSPTEREAAKELIAELDIKGYTQSEIAKEISVSQPMVCKMLAEIRQDYKDSYVDDRKMWVMKATRAHLGVIKEAQEQIAKLKEHGKVKRVRKSGTNAKGEFDEEGTQEEYGDIGGYLSIITENWTRIARLHGLEELPAQVFNLQVNNNTVNVFDQLLAAVLGVPAQPALPAIPVEGTSS